MAAMLLVCAELGQADGSLARAVHIDIAAAPLSSALIQFSTQAGVQVAAADTDVSPLQSQGLKGDYTVEEALNLLLQHTGLSFSRVGSSTIVIRSAASVPRSALHVAASGTDDSLQAPGSPRGTAASNPKPGANSTSEGTAATLSEVEITAQGHELATKISAFVNQITFGDSPEALARWQDPVCPSVSGLRREDGEFILGRVSEIAQAAGVPLAKERCRPNLFILVNAEPAALLKAMHKRNRLFTFGHSAPGVIDDFIATPRAVRVWYHTVERTPEGLPLVSFEFPDLNHGLEVKDGYSFQGPEPDGPAFRTNPKSNSSHLTLNVVYSIYRVFVVADYTRLKGLSRQQLADYIAMVGLAQLRPASGLGDVPSILRLFEGTPQAARAGMSNWDQAFLKCLYETEQKSKLQRGQIALNMVRELIPR
jgi:hypothetical protein